MAATLDRSLRKARSHAAKGEPEEAARLYAEVLAAWPGNRRARDGLADLGGGDPAKVLTAEGVRLHRAGDLGRAAERYRQALALDPVQPQALGNLGAILLAGDDPEGAVPLCARAVALEPGFAEGWNNLGIARRGAGDAAGALEAFAKAAELKPASPEILSNLGASLSNAGRPEMAIRCLKAALSLRADAEAMKNLAPLVSGADAAALLPQARALRDAAEGGQARLLAGYAVAALARSVGRPEEALAALEEAGRLGKHLSGYDAAEDAALFAEIEAAFGGEAAPVAVGEPLPAVPVFILGMPRSGTSLAEQILASHPAVHAAGERMVLARLIGRAGGVTAAARPEGIAALREGYRAALAEHAGPGIVAVTDKMPLNFRWIGHVRRALPEAKILHLRRSPEAVCWSCYRLHFPARGMAFSFDQGDVGRYYRLYDRLMGFWQRQYPGFVADVGYEALTEAPEPAIRAMMAHLGLPFVPELLEFHKTARIVETASAGQVRKPLYTGSSEEWRRYADGLGPMLAALAGEGCGAE